MFRVSKLTDYATVVMTHLARSPDVVLEEFFKNVHFPRRQSRQALQLQRNEGEDLVGFH